METGQVEYGNRVGGNVWGGRHHWVGGLEG